MEPTQFPENKDITYLGETTFRNKNQLFGIKRKDRRQHVYVLGKSGTGKSALLTNMVMQNIINGDGVCVVDPHGELVEDIVAAIPPHRMKDVVYFNPADTDYHIGLNVLELIDPQYKHLVASGLMGIFTKIWANVWSARMEYILNNAILALLETPGTTLLGVTRMLVDKPYRKTIVDNIKDPIVKGFWVNEYDTWQDKFRNEAITPIQNKVGQFLSSSIVRNVVGQSKSTINLFEIMNERKIFLVNVSKGRIGEDNSALLGGMLITKIQLAAMERVRILEDQRKDFYLYVDEFQNFVTDSFANILSEARKYRLNLTVAHQYTAQLVSANGSAVRDAVFGNVGTMIVFRVGAEDADFLEKEFEPEFMAQDIVSLPNYRIYLKLMIDGVTSRPFSAKTLPPMVTKRNLQTEQEVIDISRKLYARPREIVEGEISEWSGMFLNLSAATAPKGGKEIEQFPVKCSICAKDTLVPFKPEPGRPVYCKDCIAKMKEGTLKPLPFTAPKIVEEKKIEAPIQKTINEVKIPVITPPIPAQIAFKPAYKDPLSPTPAPIAPKPAYQATQNQPFKPALQQPIQTIQKPIPQNNALKDVLAKAMTEKKVEQPVQPKIFIPTVQPTPAPVSLDSLKSQTNSLPNNFPKDKGASSDDMNKFKDFITEKVSQPQTPPTTPQQKEEIKTSPQLSPEKARETVKEVPEDVLLKILE
ncbi:MAG: type IV secretion system DNA-binding domain-containing protein [Candidatus Nomurabacteria bacterium]|nr:type IV secretion system DNA-binding domain-containing protein [Candidatus Nomurabacteria bacterium]